mgnify:CR=1 FL=1
MKHINNAGFIKAVFVILCMWSGGFFILNAYAADNDVVDDFDHSETGFILTGQHSILSCESCHIRGIFKGIPTQCEGCHDRVSQIASSIKSINHLQTNASCDDCHTDSAWSIVCLDHSELTGLGNACHNVLKAEGKPFDHIHHPELMQNN